MTIGTIDNNGQRQITTGIAGVNDNDIVIETGDVSAFSRHELKGVTQAVDVDVSVDGVSFALVIAMTDQMSLTPATKVLIAGNTGPFTFEGHYKNIRVRQSGALAATGFVLHSTK